jgi:hypothetical protein
MSKIIKFFRKIFPYYKLFEGIRNVCKLRQYPQKSFTFTDNRGRTFTLRDNLLQFTVRVGYFHDTTNKIKIFKIALSHHTKAIQSL